MTKTHKSKAKTEKQPKQNYRKDGRPKLKVIAKIEGKTERAAMDETCYYEYKQEEQTIQSIASAADISTLHRSVSQDNFPHAIKMLKDPNLDSEDKKFAAVKFVGESGTTVTQEAIRRKAPYELIELLVFIGGKESVTAKNENGYNTIHLACKYGSCSEVLDTLVYIAGKEPLYDIDHVGELPIHKVCFRNGTSTAVLKTLIDAGGREMLEHKNHDEMLPLHCSVYYFNTNLEVCEFLITEGFHHGVGGEEAGGGLFTEYHDIDRTDKTPLDKLKERMDVNKFIGRINNVVSEKYGTTLVEAAAKNGLEWERGMKDLWEQTDPDLVKLGMVIYAASGENADLTTIYELTRHYVGQLFG